MFLWACSQGQSRVFSRNKHICTSTKQTSLGSSSSTLGHWELRINWTNLPRNDEYMLRQVLCTKVHTAERRSSGTQPPEVPLPLLQ